MSEIDDFAKDIVGAIFTDLFDRSGLDAAWDEVRPEQQVVIRTTCERRVADLLVRRFTADALPEPGEPPDESPSWPVESIPELQEAIDRGALLGVSLAAYIDKNELYIVGEGGKQYFSGVVAPEDVAWLLGIADVNHV